MYVYKGAHLCMYVDGVLKSIFSMYVCASCTYLCTCIHMS